MLHKYTYEFDTTHKYVTQIWFAYACLDHWAAVALTPLRLPSFATAKRRNSNEELTSRLGLRSTDPKGSMGMATGEVPGGAQPWIYNLSNFTLTFYIDISFSVKDKSLSRRLTSTRGGQTKLHPIWLTQSSDSDGKSIDYRSQRESVSRHNSTVLLVNLWPNSF
jgi:hypothetical protein